MHLFEKFKNAITYKTILENKKLLEEFDNLEYVVPNKLLESNTDIILGQNVYNDIEFSKVLKIIDNCYLRGGSEFLNQITNIPIKNIDVLNNRKSILQNIENIITDDDIVALKELKTLEQDLLWVFHAHPKHLEDLYNMAYFRFRFFKKLNSSSETLTAYNVYRILLSPLIGLLSPIIYFIVPYLIINYKFKMKIGFFQYIKFTFMMLNKGSLFEVNNNFKYVTKISYIFSLIFYFQGLFNSFEISKTLYKINKHIIQKINNVISFSRKATELIKKLWTPDIITYYSLCPDFFKTLESEESYIETFNKINNINFGSHLKQYKFIDKDIIKSILYKTYVLDAFNNLVQFKKTKNYVYASFMLSDGEPIYQVTGITHPTLINPVENTLDLQGDRKNMILTACNSAGKSVLIKSILVNIILAQTVTISCCSKKCNFTPFDHINSQINIPDCTGVASLFEASMFRCKDNLDILQNLKGNSIIVMDEVFSSTNPIEAISGAYAICNKISTYKNNLLIFTTHFNYLTKLAKDTKRFKNYKMETNVLNDNIDFTYKLVRGVNKQYLALELLKLNGFDSTIIDEALAIKKTFY